MQDKILLGVAWAATLEPLDLAPRERRLVAFAKGRPSVLLGIADTRPVATIECHGIELARIGDDVLHLLNFERLVECCHMRALVAAVEV